MALALPPEVTVVAAAGGTGDEAPALWCGSRTHGRRARAAARPRYLSGDLTDDADRLSVACAAHRSLPGRGRRRARLVLRRRALFARRASARAAAGRALAVVEDGAARSSASSSDPPFKNIDRARASRPAARGRRTTATGDTVEMVALGAGPTAAGRRSRSRRSRPAASCGWASARSPRTARSRGRGALEIALASTGKGTVDPSRRAVAEGGERRRACRCRTISRACSSTARRPGSRRAAGSIAWQESELRHWGENEHMDSEVCLGVAKGSDGKIWAATSAGAGRFDGTEWRFPGDGPAVGAGARGGARRCGSHVAGDGERFARARRRSEAERAPPRRRHVGRRRRHARSRARSLRTHLGAGKRGDRDRRYGTGRDARPQAATTRTATGGAARSGSR